jgi:hypothetical protein
MPRGGEMNDTRILTMMSKMVQLSLSGEIKTGERETAS